MECEWFQLQLQGVDTKFHNLGDGSLRNLPREYHNPIPLNHVSCRTPHFPNTWGDVDSFGGFKYLLKKSGSPAMVHNSSKNNGCNNNTGKQEKTIIIIIYNNNANNNDIRIKNKQYSQCYHYNHPIIIVLLNINPKHSTIIFCTIYYYHYYAHLIVPLVPIYYYTTMIIPLYTIK